MSIEITNIDEFKQELNDFVSKRMKIAGHDILKAITRKVEDMELIGKGALRQRGYFTHVEQSQDEVSLILETGLSYAVYLEYGTYSYFNRYGLNSFPNKPDPKKKNMSPNQRKEYPKGMQPFAPIRKVLWNKQVMEEIFSDAFK